MKTKKLLIAGLLLATACGVAYCSTAANESAQSGVKLTGVKVDNTESIDFSRFKWLKQYPQLANIESNNQTAVIDKLRTSESISQLIGPINNPYGVRDDILEQIMKMVPESNPQMLQAAIKEAYYDNLAIYSTVNSDKLANVLKSGTAMHCLLKFDNSYRGEMTDKIVRMFDKFSRNTTDRAQYVHNIETNVFGWQIISRTSTETDKQCLTGEY